ncbi:MAG TPA: outer membrane beta-barrel protein [Gemmatimonadaceae bacterium]|nr:outer membrane beta-barrel protein [Gemmatimonadaceae bacterium]
MSIVRALILSAAVTLALPAVAPGQSIVALGVAAGATVPAGGLGDRTSSGYHAMVTMSVHAPLTPFTLRGEGMFNQLDYNDKSGPGGGAVRKPISSNARVWAATANAMFTFSPVLGPYVIGGLGYYRTTEVDLSSGGTSSSNAAGGNIGAGFRLALTGFSIYGEARYHWLSGTDVRIVPLSVGITF